jgi:signal transduction histidine kinase
MRQLMNGVSDIIYVLDLENNNIEFLNSRVTDILYRENDGEAIVDGNIIFDRALHPDDQTKRKVHLAMCGQTRDGEAIEIDLRLKVKDGTYRWFRARDLIFSRRKGGTAHLITGIIRPVPAGSETSPEPGDDMARLLLRQNNELQLLRSEMETFTKVVAQEYLETLKQVYLSLEIIISSEAQSFSNPGRAHLRRAQAMLQRLNLLTRDITSYAEIGTPGEPIATVDPGEIIDKAMADLQLKITTSNARIERQPLPSIRGYSSLLSVLFYQLLANALKFKQTSRPLVIHIFAESLSPGQTLHPPAYREKAYDKIVISDNGSGFDPADHERIFAMFYQGHNRMLLKGSGTGLAIARKIMDIHGGFIAADSNPGKGAEISCYFPV